MKKIKKLLLALSLTVILSICTSVITYANNSSDTLWDVKNNVGTYDVCGWKTILTEARDKTDSTSGYGNVTSGNYACMSYCVNMQLKTISGRDLVGKYRVLPMVQFFGNVAHYVPSNAYENGYRSVKMSITNVMVWSWATPTAKGKWSPDSY